MREREERGLFFLSMHTCIHAYIPDRRYLKVRLTKVAHFSSRCINKYYVPGIELYQTHYLLELEDGGIDLHRTVALEDPTNRREGLLSNAHLGKDAATANGRG